MGSAPLLPQQTARLAGTLYVALTISAITAEVWLRPQLRLLSSGAAPAATPLLLYRLTFLADVFTAACDIAVAALLYALLRPLAPTAALLATCLRVVMAAMLVVSSAITTLPLVFLEQKAPARPGGVDVHVLARAAASVGGLGVNAALSLFGLHLILVGVVLLRSKLTPALIGLLLVLGGVAYTGDSCAKIIWPGVDHSLLPSLSVLWALSEWSFIGWLIVRGVDVRAYTPPVKR